MQSVMIPSPPEPVPPDPTVNSPSILKWKREQQLDNYLIHHHHRSAAVGFGFERKDHLLNYVMTKEEAAAVDNIRAMRLPEPGPQDLERFYLYWRKLHYANWNNACRKQRKFHLPSGEVIEYTTPFIQILCPKHVAYVHPSDYYHEYSCVPEYMSSLLDKNKRFSRYVHDHVNPIWEAPIWGRDQMLAIEPFVMLAFVMCYHFPPTCRPSRRKYWIKVTTDDAGGLNYVPQLVGIHHYFNDYYPQHKTIYPKRKDRDNPYVFYNQYIRNIGSNRDLHNIPISTIPTIDLILHGNDEENHWPTYFFLTLEEKQRQDVEEAKVIRTPSEEQL
jgi:hypothetical protein